LNNSFTYIKWFIISILLLGATTIFSQNSVKIADKLYKQGKYCEAIKYYNKYLKEFVDEKAFLKRGISNYNCKHFKSAIKDLENCILMGSYDKRIHYYLAKTYHDQQNFDKAIIYYKKYLRDAKNDERTKTINNIKRCANAIDLKYETTDHFIENWGPKINTPYNDILPLQSPSNNHHFYFSSDRVYGIKSKKRYREFQVDFSDGNWEKLYDIYSSNQNRNTIFIDFQNNASKVIYFAGYTSDKGTIHSSDYSRISKQLKDANLFEAPIHAEFGFSYLQYINDSTIIFSSNKKGGYGGYDLYITGKRSGKWFEPINLGRNINTAFDEISPFITKSGDYLFFSSNNLNSVGGFDVFKSKFSYNDDDWTQPKNMGMPINSAGNESGFRILSSGKGGIYNSDRKDMGFGENDLYWIYFKTIIDVNRAYSTEMPYLRNRHLKLISPPVIEKEVVIVEEKKKDKTDIKPKTTKGKDSGNVKKKAKNKAKHKNNKPPKKHIDKPKTKKPTKKKPKLDINKKKFIVPLIFIKDNKFRDNNTTIDFIDKLARTMKEYPQIVVEFVGNSFVWDSEKSELTNSVRITEGLADSLILRMVNPKRIIIKGVGSSLPAAKPFGPKRSKNIILKTNNRIDVFIHNIDDLPLLIKNEHMYISKSIEDSRYKLYKTVIKGLSYKVQVNKGDFLFTDKLLSKFEDSSIEKDAATKTYYYTIGLYKEYISAKELYKSLIAEGSSNIKIIPYIDGIRIDKKEALIKAKKYLDLVNYLEDN